MIIIRREGRSGLPVEDRYLLAMIRKKINGIIMQMSEEEIRIHLNNITQLIHQLLYETEDIGYEEFRKDEQMKERVYTQLQEIGEASREILDTTNPYSGDQEVVEALGAFRNARFNLEAEIGGQVVWSVIHEDLPFMEEVLVRKIKNSET